MVGISGGVGKGCWLPGEELDGSIGMITGGDGGVGNGASTVGSDAAG